LNVYIPGVKAMARTNFHTIEVPGKAIHVRKDALEFWFDSKKRSQMSLTRTGLGF
jgi:hypothetical protein